MAYDMILTAMADATRRSILERLRSGPRNVAGLADGMPVSRPAISQHLKVLSDAGMLTISQAGTSRIYALNPQGLNDLRRYLDELWDDAINSYASYVEQEEKND